MITKKEELIKETKKFKTEQEKLSFIMNYLLQTVEYDYRYLLIKGYMQESISEIAPFSPNEDLIENPFKKEKIVLKINGEERTFNDSLLTTRRISKGYSKLLEEIDQLEKNSPNEDDFYLKLKKLLEKELEKHIDNKEMIEKNIERIISDLKERKRTGQLAKNYFIGKDIKSILIEMMLEPDKYMHPIIENGILKKGVCKHFAKYIKELLEEVGIKSTIIYGTSELGHAWIGAVVDNELKSIDLTRAIFIRDHFRNIPTSQKEEDWLIADFKDTFYMQPKRTITGIGGENNEEINLPVVMNKDNFDEEILKKYITKQEDKKIEK